MVRQRCWGVEDHGLRNTKDHQVVPLAVSVQVLQPSSVRLPLLLQLVMDLLAESSDLANFDSQLLNFADQY